MRPLPTLPPPAPTGRCRRGRARHDRTTDRERQEVGTRCWRGTGTALVGRWTLDRAGVAACVGGRGRRVGLPGAPPRARGGRGRAGGARPRRRYARGVIDDKEYRERLRVLQEQAAKRRL